MKLVCPACGAVASLESWQNDAIAREVLATCTTLPAPLPRVVLSYISLFRPRKSALAWKKALRLVTEISELAGPGYIHVADKVDRNCPPRIWAEAMEQMVAQRGQLELPMKSHNYLKRIAWGLADEVDRQREYHRPALRVKTDSDSTTVGAIVKRVLNPLDQYIQGERDDKPSEDEMSAWHRKQLG